MYSLRPKVHVLNFFIDDDQGAAITVLVNGVRFHIIADPTELKDSENNGEDGGKVWDEYMRLVKAASAAEKENEQGGDGKETEKTYEEGKEKEEDTANEGERWCICSEPSTLR